MNRYRNDFYQSSSADIIKKIKELAGSYLPEWVLDEDNPDSSAAIAHIFADIMEQEIDYYNLFPERFRVEFANMYGASQKGATAAHSVVAFSSGVTDAKVKVPLGTELVAAAPPTSETGGDLIFRTLSNVAVTDVDVERIVSVSQKHEKIIEFPKDNAELFGYKGENLYKNQLIIKPDFECLSKTNIIRIRFRGNRDSASLADVLTRDRFKYYFSSGGMLQSAMRARKREDYVEVIKADDMSFDEIVISLVGSIGVKIELTGIEILPEDNGGKVERILRDGLELDSDRFEPFGNKLEEYASVYLCDDSIFRHVGARATLSFKFEIEENIFNTEAPLKDDRLPLIKRKPAANPFERRMSDSYAQEIAFEYYNGIGWKTLETQESVVAIFSKDAPRGEKEIKFVIPYDWNEVTEGGYVGRCIRMRIKRADNCYLFPCTHHYPVISDMRLEYSYGGEWKHPVEVIFETTSEKRDITALLWGEEEIPVFGEFPFEHNEIYLELTGKFKDGPIGIFFNLSDSVSFEGTTLSFSYSSMKGFKPMYVIDNTDGFTKSGTILFMPPTDLSVVNLFGEPHFYIRIVDVLGRYSPDKAFRPRLNGLIMNAVEVANIVELPSESFYIEEVRHNQSFQLSAGNILDADIWVNEMGDISSAEMNYYIEQQSEDIRIERNIRGDISDFYIKWREVDDFGVDDGDGRVYRIDRVNNLVIFGNGINQKIPSNTSSIAFMVVQRITDGSDANIEAGSITDFRRNVLFVNEIIHPISSYGGSSLENVYKACDRASEMISSRNRLVSEEDIALVAMSYSENVNQAACVFEGEILKLVLLMDDYLNGPFSFRIIKKEMETSFVKKLPLTIGRDCFEIVEPLFVRVSLDVWIIPNEKGKEFEVVGYWTDKINRFLNPLVINGSGGWPIGTLPTDKQFNMLFNDTGNLSKVDHYQVTASFSDEEGVHNCELSRLYDNPRVVPVNGTHNIHMEWN